MRQYNGSCNLVKIRSYVPKIAACDFFTVPTGTFRVLVAIFSVVTQFDVCPVAGYNCRMQFFGHDRYRLPLQDRHAQQDRPGQSLLRLL